MTNAKVEKRKVLSVDALKENLHYDPETGIFTRLKQCTGTSKLGDTAGCLNSRGYLTIMVNGVSYRAHRLAWLYMTGTMPKELIDHKNGIKTDNRFNNLRQATHKQNMENQITPRKNNKSGFLGVSFYKSLQNYRAFIRIDGKRLYLGQFNTAEEASSLFRGKKKAPRILYNIIKKGSRKPTTPKQ